MTCGRGCPASKVPPRFLTPLRAEKVQVGLWRLVEPLVFEYEGSRVTVPAGFLTDFASVPRVPFVYLLVGDTAHEAAVIHDYLYREDGVPRSVADRILRLAMEATGEPAWRRWAMWAAVRVFGGPAWSNYRAMDAERETP